MSIPSCDLADSVKTLLKSKMTKWPQLFQQSIIDCINWMNQLEHMLATHTNVFFLYIFKYFIKKQKEIYMSNKKQIHVFCKSLTDKSVGVSPAYLHHIVTLNPRGPRDGTWYLVTALMTFSPDTKGQRVAPIRTNTSHCTESFETSLNFSLLIYGWIIEKGKAKNLNQAETFVQSMVKLT